MFGPGMFEYGLKTGDLTEEEMVKIFEKALTRIAREINDPRFTTKGRKKLRKSTGPFGRPAPDAEPPEYDHIYIFNHRVSNLFLELYPNRETNGRIKFADEGIIWNLYVTILRDYPPRISEQDHLQEFGERFMQELFRTLSGEKVLIKQYAPGEDRL